MPTQTDLILDGGRFQLSVLGNPTQVHTIKFNPTTPARSLQRLL